MKETVGKYRTIEKELTQSKGEFRLFALFLREDSSGKWDLLVSGRWIDEDKQAALKEIATELSASLTKDELLTLSRIIIVEENSPELKAFNQTTRVVHGDLEVLNSNFFGLDIRHAFIITSKAAA